jgi:hypothetical protein
MGLRTYLWTNAMPTDLPPLTPPRNLTGHIDTVLTGNRRGRLAFVTAPAERLTVDLEGILDNRYRGWTRAADSRAPYVPRGRPIRNDRQISLVSHEDLADIARALDVPVIDPAWIGANVVVAGLPAFSYLPRGTRLFTSGGAILTVTDQNAPCTLSGEVIGDAIGRPETKLQFAKIAHGRRGLVAVVEHPGTIDAGSPLDVRLPAQWIYEARGERPVSR